jgi:hypothetical protein
LLQLVVLRLLFGIFSQSDEKEEILIVLRGRVVAFKTARDGDQVRFVTPVERGWKALQSVAKKR